MAADMICSAKAVVLSFGRHREWSLFLSSLGGGALMMGTMTVVGQEARTAGGGSEREGPCGCVGLCDDATALQKGKRRKYFCKDRRLLPCSFRMDRIERWLYLHPSFTGCMCDSLLFTGLSTITWIS
jgi:hypothetical protein